MSVTKTLAAAAAVSLLFGLSAAEAAKPKPKKPVCNLMKDVTGDATGTGTAAVGPNESTLDLVSADVATNTKTLTVVYRLAAMDATPNTAPTGRGFELSFMVKGQTVVWRGSTAPTGDKWGDGVPKIDTAKKEVRVSIPIAKFSTPFKANDKLTNLRASTWRYIGPNTPFGMVDKADGLVAYVSAWPSCVKVGA